MFSAVARRVLLIAVLCAPQAAFAEALPNELMPVIDGQPYGNINVVTGQAGIRTINYFRVEESPTDWTRKGTYTRVRSESTGDDPKKVAAQLIGALHKVAPNTEYNLTGSKDGKTYMLDFAYLNPGTGQVELSMYRLEGAGKGKGVYSVSFVMKVPFSTETQEQSVKQLTHLRGVTLNILSKYDMDTVREILDSLAVQ